MAAQRQFVVFRLDREEYGAPIERVREVGVYQRPTRLPGTPEYVEGVISLRGQVIPIIDLRRRLGLPPRAPDGETRILVLEAQPLTGLVVDGVREVLRVGEEEVEPPQQVGPGIRPEYLEGIARKDDRLILLVDVDRLLGLEPVTRGTPADPPA